jgi:protein-S-isoprenylcysteine O-methyltransferase Ste14
MSFVPGLSTLVEKVPDLTTPRGIGRALLMGLGVLIGALAVLRLIDSFFAFGALLVQLGLYAVNRMLLADFFNGRRDRMSYTDGFFGRFLPAAGINLASLLFILSNGGGATDAKGHLIALTPWLIGRPIALYLFVTAGLLFWRSLRVTGVDTLAGAYIYYPDEGKQINDATYRLLRHPVYASMDRLALGFALWNGSALALLLAVIFAALWHPVWYGMEEAELIERFGDSYREYMARVPATMPSGPAGEINLLEALTRPAAAS